MPLGREEPERHADQHGEEPRGEGELDGGGEALADLRRDRAARRDARAEITLDERRLQVAQVLHVDRVVQPELVADLGDRLLVCPLAQKRLGRAARERPHPDEDEDRQPDQDRDEQEQPADREAEHSGSGSCPPAAH
jgi:hypothetical protein